MTPLDKLLARLRELESKSTAGPWMESLGVIKDQENVNDICAIADKEFWSSDLTREQDESNAWFIAESRNALPVLLDIVARQNEALDFYSWLDNTDIDGPDMSSIAKKAIAECDALAEQADNQP